MQGSTLMALLNACHWLKMQALILVLNAAEAWSMRGLRGKLGLPLTGGPAGRTCVPVVDARSVNWLLEEPQLMGPNQVGVWLLGMGTRRYSCVFWGWTIYLVQLMHIYILPRVGRVVGQH